MKTKTRKELALEDNRNAWVIVAIVFFSMFVVYSILYDNKIDGLKTQLSECQEQVEVWTLKVRCVEFSDYAYGSINSSVIIQGLGFGDYQRVLKQFQELENCEVIE